MTVRRFVVAIATAAVLFAGGYRSAIAQQMGVQVVGYGSVLNAPGQYILDSDLSCPAFPVIILGSNIRLDFADHGITCNDPTRIGLLLFSSTNVQVTNGSISGCSGGIVFLNTDDSKVTKMTLTGNMNSGIALVGANDNDLSGNTASENGRLGIVLSNSDGNKLIGNVTTGNRRSGLAISATAGGSSSNNSLRGNESNGNELAGIALLGAVSNNIVRGNEANNNLLNGIALLGFEGTVELPIAGPDNVVQGNEALGNANQDLFEGAVDPDTLETVRIADECANIWKSNTFVSSLGPDMCIQ